MESKQQLLEIVGKFERDRYEYLNELFKYVPDIIVKAISYKEIQKEQYILYAGAPCDTVYIILSGSVVGLDHQKKGHVYYFMDLTQMYIVGDFEVFGDIPEYSVSICATEDCKLLTVPSAYYLQWIQHDENALFLRIKNIMATLTLEKKKEREYMFMNCRERLMSYLLSSYESEKPDGSGNYKVTKTQSELANRIGFNIRSVQRQIAALEKEELISIENRKITISQAQFLKLKQCADNLR